MWEPVLDGSQCSPDLSGVVAIVVHDRDAVFFSPDMASPLDPFEGAKAFLDEFEIYAEFQGSAYGCQGIQAIVLSRHPRDYLAQDFAAYVGCERGLEAGETRFGIAVCGLGM